jgi:uncharacterized membrane protein
MPRRLLAAIFLAIGFPLASFVVLHTRIVPALWLAAPDAVITAGVLMGLCARGGLRLRLAAGLLGSGLALVALGLWPERAVYAFPVLINLFLAQLFRGTLADGEALVTRIARMERGGALPEELARYTRKLTAAWAWFFLALAANGLLLALLSPVETALLFANTLNYAFIAVFFAAEYVYRRIRYRAYGHPPVLRLIRTLAERGWMIPEAGHPSSKPVS